MTRKHSERHRRWPRVWLAVKRHQMRWQPPMAALVALFILGTGYWLREGDPFAIWGTCLAAALTCATVRAGLGVFASPRRGGWRARLQSARVTGKPATFAPYTSSWEGLTWLLYLSLIALLSSAPLVAAAPYTGSARYEGTLTFLATFGPFIALGFVPYLLSPAIRGFRRMGVGMTPEGVYHWEWFGCSFYGWDEIRYVVPIREHTEIVVHLVGKRGVDHEEQYERVPDETWLNKYQWYRNRASRIHAGHLTVNPALMLEALAFYHANPELRAELGTTAAVSRFHQNAFPVNDWS